MALILAEVFFYRTWGRRVNVSLVVISIVLLWLAFVSVARLPEMGRWSNPNRTPLPILSDWYFLALYQLVKHTPPLWAGIAPALLIGYSMLIPFLDRTRETRPTERPFFFAVGVLALAYWIGFSTLILLNIAVIGRDPPIIMAVTFVVLDSAFVWDVVHRRRKARKAAQLLPPTRAVGYGTRGGPMSTSQRRFVPFALPELPDTASPRGKVPLPGGDVPPAKQDR